MATIDRPVGARIGKPLRPEGHPTGDVERHVPLTGASHEARLTAPNPPTAAATVSTMRPRPTPLFLALAVLVAALTAGACSSDGAEVASAGEDTRSDADPADGEADDGEADDEAEAEADAGGSSLGSKPDVVVPEGDAPTELAVEDIVVGSGEEAAAGDFLTMHYVGVRYDDGGQFDASWDRDQTFELVLGIGQVIPGWDEGIQGMREGGRRQLVIPPDMAYGERGAGADIPPDSTLVFVVDLLEAIPPLEVANAPEPATELETAVLVEGAGQEIRAGTTVKVLYTAMLQRTGEVFDSSWRSGRSAGFVVAAEPSQAIPAWDQALVGRRVGDHLRLVIPPELGIGEGGPIRADDTIITELLILAAEG